jgi:hypothetical protein
MMSGGPTNSFSEQLYIDARLEFAIKHPLDWERLQIPVSSPEYRTDTVRWQVKDPEGQDRGIGEMLIRSLPADPKRQLPDLLSSYLADLPELKAGQTEEIEMAVGPALKLLGHDEKQGRLTIATKGQQHDYIISLEYPSSRFDELLPIFQDIVNSFTEVLRPVDQAK